MQRTELLSDSVDENTQLHTSILSANQTETLKLLDNASDEELQQWLQVRALGNSPLNLAMKTAAFAVADRLIDLHKKFGISVDQQDDSGMSVLHWAAFYHHDSLINKLLENGANKLLQTQVQLLQTGVNPFQVYNANYAYILGEFLFKLKRGSVPIIKQYQPETCSGFLLQYAPEITNIVYHMDRICINLGLVDRATFLKSPTTQTASYFAECCKQGLDKLCEYLKTHAISRDITSQLRIANQKDYPVLIKTLFFSTGRQNPVIELEVDVNNEPASVIQKKLEEKTAQEFDLLIFAGYKLEDKQLNDKRPLLPQYVDADNSRDPIHAVVRTENQLSLSSEVTPKKN